MELLRVERVPSTSNISKTPSPSTMTCQHSAPWELRVLVDVAHFCFIDSQCWNTEQIELSLSFPCALEASFCVGSINIEHKKHIFWTDLRVHRHLDRVRLRMWSVCVHVCWWLPFKCACNGVWRGQFTPRFHQECIYDVTRPTRLCFVLHAASFQRFRSSASWPAMC